MTKLDPDVFTALGLAAEAHGGVGKDDYFIGWDEPCCIYGLARWLDRAGSVAENELKLTGISANLNDRVVQLLTCFDDRERVTFEEWCRGMNVKAAND